MMGSATKPCLPTERSEDPRTDGEKAELLAWVRPCPISVPSYFIILFNHGHTPPPQADRCVARNPYIPPPPEDESFYTKQTTKPCLPTERSKPRTDEKKAAELLA